MNLQTNIQENSNDEIRISTSLETDRASSFRTCRPSCHLCTWDTRRRRCSRR